MSHAFDGPGGPLPVLDDVTLSVAAGEFVALLGPSGCGKSTLLRLVAGLDAARQGAIVQDGVPIERPDPSRIVVFQDPTLYPWRRVRANVALGLEARGVAWRAPRSIASTMRSRASAFRNSRTCFRISCRAGWRSVSRSPARSSTIRAC
ncbi:ABC transporter [Burkholderia diffusa]|uniref:ABC transporter n=1 Tax=Burkholderia diffusa TaxID=488732 RepID=A0A6P2NLA1_9BURK|nr:ABC transporter [Burkholderia diffusa]